MMGERHETMPESGASEKQQAKLHGAIEESLAEKKRGEYVRELFGGAAEKAIEESEALEKLSKTDFLTKVSNRRGFLEDIKKITSQFSSHGIRRREFALTNLTILMLDIDKFKGYNDQYGHNIGDQVLQSVARQLKEHLRGSDLVGRWGGEEFILAFPGATPEEIEKKFASEPDSGKAPVTIEMDIEAQTDQGETLNLRVTFSGGIADFRPEENIEDTITRADASLYVAKESGRNQLLYRPDALSEEATA